MVPLRPISTLLPYPSLFRSVSMADCPLQIAGGGVTVMTGRGFTVTVTCAVAEQPLLSVPVSVFVFVDEHRDLPAFPAGRSSDVDGVQVYVCAPLAVSVADCPLQIAEGGVTVMMGRGFTVTVTCAVAEQPLLSVPVTV